MGERSVNKVGMRSSSRRCRGAPAPCAPPRPGPPPAPRPAPRPASAGARRGPFELGELGAEDQILAGDLAVGLLVAALVDGARRTALVGVFELLADSMLRIAEIKLGADAGIAQRRRHLLIVADAVAIEQRD